MRAADRFDVEQLVRDVKSVYDGYSADSLEEMWQYKEYVMARVAQDGGNEYERHRKHVRGQYRYSVGRYLGVCLPWSNCHGAWCLLECHRYVAP